MAAAEAAAAAEKILTLRSSDNEVFEVEESVAKKSQTIKNMLEDECAGVIPLANVHSKILTKVLEYCRKHAQTKAADGDSDKDAKAPDAELGTFDVDFAKVDQATLFDLILIMRERLTSPSHLDHEDTRQHDHEDTVQQVNLFNAMDIQTLKKILKPLGKDVGKNKEELARRADFEFDSKLKTLTRPALRKLCEKNKVLFVATDSRSDLVSKLIYQKKKMIEKSVRSLGSTTAKKGCDGVIPLPNVHSKILTLVIEYCTHHTQTKAANTHKYCRHSDADKDFDKKFVDVDQNTLFDLILAASYLDIKDLLDLTCETLANMIRGKKPEEIRKTFHIKNDLTKEEEEIRRDYQWAFAPPWQLMQSNQQG